MGASFPNVFGVFHDIVVLGTFVLVLNVVHCDDVSFVVVSLYDLLLYSDECFLEAVIASHRLVVFQ